MGVQRIPEDEHDGERRQRFADQDDRDDGEHLQWLANENARVEEHPDRHEEQHGEGIAERRAVS